MKIIMFFVSFLFLYSCNKAQLKDKSFNTESIKYFFVDNTSLKRIVLEKRKEAVVSDSIFSEDVRFVRLETNQNCLIGHIDRVLFSDSLIFIVDGRITKAIYIFDQNGLFKNKIANRGKGPAEYLDIQDVEINQKRKEIGVLDGYGMKINFFNFEGEFVRTVSTEPVIFYSFASLDSLNYILDKGRFSDNCRKPSLSNARLLCSDLKNIASIGINIEKGQDQLHRTTARQFWKFDSGIYFNKPFHDTIYRVTNDTIYADYYLDFDGLNIPYDKKLKLTDHDFKEVDAKYAYLNGDFIDLECFLYMYLFYPEFGMHTIYCKESQRVISGADFVSYNPIFSLIRTPVGAYGNNTIVVALEANFVLGFRWEACPVKDKYPHLKNQFEELVSGLKRDDNPTLAFYTFKKF